MLHATARLGRAEGHVPWGVSLEGEQLNQQGNAWLEPCQHLPPLEIALTESQGAGMKSPSLGLLHSTGYMKYVGSSQSREN